MTVKSGGWRPAQWLQQSWERAASGTPAHIARGDLPRRASARTEGTRRARVLRPFAATGDRLQQRQLDPVRRGLTLQHDADFITATFDLHRYQLGQRQAHRAGGVTEFRGCQRQFEREVEPASLLALLRRPARAGVGAGSLPLSGMWSQLSPGGASSCAG